ncbi:MAG: flagellar assembly protein FliW [Negativicutes bacterium]|nr:flagellar assembly protein FliW [Negativicutes bacterium]
MIVNSTRFGEIDVPDELIIEFEQGLPGFEGERKFAYLPQGDSPFAYLQSSQNPDLTFVAVNPFAFYRDYGFEVDQATVEALGLGDGKCPLVMNIVTVPPQGVEHMTVNLVAPLLINVENKKAVQLVLPNSAYDMKKRLFPSGLPKWAGLRKDK